MSVYVYAEALQKFAFLLDEAFRTGEVKVQKDDGKIFVIKPETDLDSPLNVESLNLGITTEEILECIHESRERRL